MEGVRLSDGRWLHYERRGDEGPVLVFLNGMSQSTANWRTQARYFSERFRCVMYDARGQGRSDLGEGSVTLAGHVADLDALLDALEVPQVVLCGFSHGARIALAHAAAHPERVLRLVLTSTGDGDDALRRMIVRSWKEILRLGGVEAMAWCSLPDILGRRFLEAHETQLEAMIRATLQRNTGAGLEALLHAMDDFPAPESDASGVECPTLLVTSPDDQLVSPRSAAGLAAAIPDCEHREVTGCGHTIPIEEPEAWRDVVAEFLSR